MNGFGCVHGVFGALENLSVGLTDRAFLFGEHVFETILVKGGAVLYLESHLERLYEGLRMLKWKEDVSLETLTFEVHGVLTQSRLQNGIMRIVIGPRDAYKMGRWISLVPLDDRKKVTGVILQTATRLLPPTYQDGVPKLGSLYLWNHLENVREHKEDLLEAAYEHLWIHPEGFVSEASTSNIFFVDRVGEGVTLITPPPYAQIVKGVTRKHLMLNLRQLDIPVEEVLIDKNEIPRFDEAFLVSSIRGLCPVLKIDGHRLFTTRKNSLFWVLKERYDQWLQNEVQRFHHLTERPSEWM